MTNKAIAQINDDEDRDTEHLEEHKLWLGATPKDWDSPAKAPRGKRAA